MQHTIDNIQIIPVREKDGLLAFASLVLDNDFYIGSIGIHTRLQGGYRLSYPTRKAGENSFNIFKPINHEIAALLEAAIISKFEEVTKR